MTERHTSDQHRSPGLGGAEMWVAGCPACSEVERCSAWGKPDLVWHGPQCLSSAWGPTAVRFPG